MVAGCHPVMTTSSLNRSNLITLQHSTTGQDGVFMFEPHTRPIRHMAFQPHQPDRLYSLSYDGTVRKTHFEQGIFDEVVYKS